MVASAETQSNASRDRLINDSRVSAAIFREWQIGTLNFRTRHFF